MGSAQLDMLGLEEMADGHGLQAPLDLRQEAAERLAAHRQRRGRKGAVTTPAPAVRTRHSSVAAAVAERYAQTPSYRAFLAEEAQRAVDAARREAESAAAEAEVAARSARAVAVAQQQLLSELQLWDAPQEFTADTAEIVQAPLVNPAESFTATSPVREVFEGLTVRLYEDLGRPARPETRGNELSTAALPKSACELDADWDESLMLDEEIAFRQAPVFEPFSIEPTTPLPANLLEFPRQLVAARKARPRLAEGPLRDEAAPRSPQLRIFEVEPEQISTTPETTSVLPGWSSIRLEAHTVTETIVDASTPALLPSMLAPQTAPVSLRAMAAVVDGCVVGGAFLAFVAVASRVAGRVPTGPVAAISAVVTLALFYLVYQVLFFTFSDQTPGMRYARIGLCTLTDENPSRSAMRRRILAQLIAVCPFGLGIFWALLDDDGMGWHDRISRMYQRAY